MSDLVERLRAAKVWSDGKGGLWYQPEIENAISEAADEIERLNQCTNVVHADLCGELDNANAEIERLRAALQKISDGRYSWWKYVEIAREALGQKEAEREYEPGMNPVDDAEFGMKP